MGRGSALVLFLGVMAALSVLAIALVAVIANAQHLTSHNKARTTALDVAEAALDVTMEALAKDWPTDAKPWTASSFVTIAPEFEDTFGVAYAGTSGDAVWVSVVDDNAASPAGTYDDNGYVWVDAQARVNGVSSRIRCLVQAKFYEVNVPRGVAVCAEGQLVSNAPNGNANSGKYKVGAADASIGGPQPVSIAIWGGIQNSEVAWPYVAQNPPGMPHASDLIGPDLISDLTQIARQMHRLFESPRLPARDDFNGLTVVVAPEGTTIALGQNGKDEAFNSPDSPGVLLILGGADLKIDGNTEYYGVVYCEGDIGVGTGHPIIYGMLVTQGSFDMAGVAQVIYREDCLVNLNRQFQTSTKMVPGYWRELQPVDYAASAP